MRGGVAPAGGNPSLLLCAAVLLCTAAVSVAYVQFEPVLVPKTGRTRSSIIGTQKVTYGRITRQRFQKVARTTEDHNCILRGCQRMGEVLDIQRNNLTNFDRETLGKAGDRATKVDFSHYPSGGVLMQEEDLGRWFMLYQFEKPNPGTVYRMRIRLENDTALASRLNIPLDFAPFQGLWKPRVAVLTPAGTMMGSEGIPPDGKLYEVAKCLLDAKRFDCLNNWDREGFVDIVEFMRYFGVLPATLLESGRLELPPAEAIPGFKPYRYGFLYEISLSVNEDDRVENNIAKLYALGRLGSHGVAVMQDGFTVYMSGGKGGLFRFVADGESNDFSRGELSVAILRLKGGAGLTTIEKGTEFTIGWIPLGRTSAESVAGFVTPDSPITFSDMFQHAESEGGVCPTGLELVTIAGTEECLKMNDAELAAVFEPERAAALVGGTVGVFQFSEMATRLDSDKFYLGAREILGGDVDVDLGKANGADNPTAPITPNECGCVFEVQVDADFQAESMVAVMCGTSDEGSDDQNKCSTEGVANPRSLTYVNQFEYLLVGEDTDLHENNYVWAWDPETRNPTRIFHSSAGGGITSLSWFQDVVGGNNYIGITISKPIDTFGWLSYFGSFDLTTPEKMTFSSVAVPYARGPKRLPISFSRVTVGEGEYFGGYKELFTTGMKLKRTGNKKQTIKLGQVVDSQFKPVQSYKDGPVEPLVIDQEEMRHKLAFTSMIDMCDNLYSVAVIDSLPATSYVISLKESKKGQLEAVSADYSDWTRWGGLWQSGGGVVSPWNSHIGGEVFEPDSLDFIGFPCLTGFSSCFKSRAEDAFEQSIRFIRYFGKYFKSLKNRFENLASIFNPYSYGYAYEVEVNKFGCSSTTKLMTLGRFSHGDIEIMPDQKTVYMTDVTAGRDIGGGLFRFIAKNKGDLSEGTLYAAKLKPVFGTLKRFELSWIKLGTGSNADLVIRSRKMKFTDMFDFIPSSKRCRLKEVNVKSSVECIDVKSKQDKFAAFFETRRYAALLGATIEFANVKGITFDRNTQKLFLSISRVTKRDRIMLQDDIEGSSNDIKVSASDCGIIYEMDTEESEDTEFDTSTFKESYRGNRDSGTFDLNECSVEDPANPGTMSSIPGHNQFLVAEDTCNLDRGSLVACGHENDALWAMDPFLAKGKRGEAREKTRLLTVPPLSAIGSMSWYPQIGGKSYISAAVNELYQGGFDGLVDKNEPGAIFGYLGPFTSAEADKRRPEIKAVKQVCDDKKPSRGGRFECPKNFKFN